MDDSSPDALLLQAIGYALPQVENSKISRRSCEGSHLGWSSTLVEGASAALLSARASLKGDGSSCSYLTSLKT